MSDKSSVNNKRIAKNTLLLYVRMIVLMLISLYTVRVTLEALGVDDYGIYNVVGGVVATFSFLKGAVSTSSQRYFSIHLARLENVSNFQGNAVVNYTSLEQKYTRVIEHKHFEKFGQSVYGLS